MIVAKALAENSDIDSPSGRLTIGILIFQDIWAIIVLAILPELGNPQITTLLLLFAKILLLTVVAVAYAKYVMPVVFKASSNNVELMLVISLCWCFFMSCFAILPFMGLSMELAALLSGVALATFPYSAEFNGKIKYLRDFFITIFFCGLGMQIPVPTLEPILTALLIAVVVLITRWIGIFLLVLVLGGGPRLAAVATINLSEVSEFALVICSLGIKYEFIEEDTLTIMIWVFALLAILSANLLPYNYKIYAILAGVLDSVRGEKVAVAIERRKSEFQDGHQPKIVFVGFHTIAAMLVLELQNDSPAIMKRLHAVDFNEKTLAKLKSKGISCSYGDITCGDVLEHAVHGEPGLVLCTVPDHKLRGVTNLKLLKIIQKIWPHTEIVVTSDNPSYTKELYEAGANYVLRTSYLCAVKLKELLTDSTHNDISRAVAFYGALEHQYEKDRQHRVSIANFR
jgi:hypothetical protein